MGFGLEKFIDIPAKYNINLNRAVLKILIVQIHYEIVQICVITGVNRLKYWRLQQQ